MKNYQRTIFLYNLLLLCLVFIGFACQNQEHNQSVNEERTELSEPPSETIAATLEAFSFTDCTPLMAEDSGCACDFRPEKDNYKSSLFVSNLGETACVKVNGSVETLKGERIDDRSEYYQQAYQEHWITLKEDGTFLIFEQDASKNEYEENRAILVQTLLVMDEMPTEIPLQFVGTTGMGTRAEIRSMAAEALEMATKAKAEGNAGMPMQMLYENDQYNILITAYVDGRNDSGGDTYAGTIELKSKKGKVLDSKNIWGDCNC